jgi:small subunit ribosomal protein S1
MIEQSSVSDAQIVSNQANLDENTNQVEENNTPSTEPVAEPILEQAPIAETLIATEVATTTEVIEVAEVAVTEVPVPEVTAPIDETPVATETATEVATTTEVIEASVATAPATERKERIPAKPRVEVDPAVLNEVLEHRNAGTSLTAKVEDRVRGGLKLNYKGLALFLPISHFGIRSNPNEEDLIRAVGDYLQVQVLEVNEDVPLHRRNIIVSRKKLLETGFWDNIKLGDIISGPVTSITTFGVFIDIGGYEGLVHISRLSRKKIDNIKNFTKKGEILQAKVVEVDKDKQRIGLSMSDLEPSMWDKIPEKFPVGSEITVKVKKFINFGAIVDLGDGIDGIIRNQDMSWTKRINDPAEILQLNTEVQAIVLSINTDKELVSLSFRAVLENPWSTIEEKIQIGQEKVGIIQQVKPEGIVVTIEGIFDGFIPKSKMRNMQKGKKLPFKKGDTIEVIVADLVVASQSLILSPKDAGEDNGENNGNNNAPYHQNRGERSGGDRERKPRNFNRSNDKDYTPQPVEMTSNEISNFSFSDMLGEDILKKLNANS